MQRVALNNLKLFAKLWILIVWSLQKANWMNQYQTAKLILKTFIPLDETEIDMVVAVWYICLRSSFSNKCIISMCVLLISLTSSRQNCNLTKYFTFISSQHVSRTSLLFTWWFWNDRQYFPTNKRCRSLLSPESESGDKRLWFGLKNWTPLGFLLLGAARPSLSPF